MNLTTAPARQSLDVAPADGEGVVVVVGVVGDVDISTAPQLMQALERLLAPPVAGSCDGQVVAVVVDLTEVEFVDSSAVGVLVRGHHLGRRSGSMYALVATAPMIHALFAMTGLDQVLPLHPDVAAAVADVAARRRRQ